MQYWVMEFVAVRQRMGALLPPRCETQTLVHPLEGPLENLPAGTTSLCGGGSPTHSKGHNTQPILVGSKYEGGPPPSRVKFYYRNFPPGFKTDLL